MVAASGRGVGEAKEVIEKGGVGFSEGFAHTFTHFNAIHWGVLFFHPNTSIFSLRNLCLSVAPDLGSI